MTLVVQIALGIVLALLMLATLLAGKHVRITVIVATILSIPMAIVATREPLIFESAYIPIVGTFVMVGVVAFGLYVFESLPDWFIKSLGSAFWLFLTVLFVTLLFNVPIHEKSLWWTMMLFSVLAFLVLLLSLRSLRRSLFER